MRGGTTSFVCATTQLTRFVSRSVGNEAIQAIFGSEVISPVKPELFREREALGICNRSAAFRHHRGDFYLAGLRSRERAEPISGAHRKPSASTTISAIAEFVFSPVSLSGRAAV